MTKSTYLSIRVVSFHVSIRPLALKMSVEERRSKVKIVFKIDIIGYFSTKPLIISTIFFSSQSSLFRTLKLKSVRSFILFRPFFNTLFGFKDS